MRLPYWLLRLLPMWDYICPRCRREVKANSHKCPYCGERFPFPIRVPPKCLKSKEELERYVHEKIFPKLSSWQREYLAQYFTIIFQDGFESGDFSAWTGTSGSPSIVTSPTHHGSYALLCDAGNEYVYKTLPSSYTHLFLRVYMQIDVQPGGGAHERHLGFALSGTEKFSFTYRDYSGVKELRLYSTETGLGISVAESLPLNQWVCIEIEYDADSDVHHLWVDGVQKIEWTQSVTSAVNQIRVGRYLGTPWTHNAYYDCVVVADTYIGPETEIILKQWSQTGITTHTFNRHKTFKLTQNLKTLGEWTLPVPAFLKQWFATLQTTHVFRRPYRSMKLTQNLNLAHVFRRPFRSFKLTQNVNLTHVLRANKLVKYLTQILKPLHNWVKRALGGFPFKISVEERQPVNVVVEAAEPIKIIVEERTE